MFEIKRLRGIGKELYVIMENIKCDVTFLCQQSQFFTIKLKVIFTSFK